MDVGGYKENGLTWRTQTLEDYTAISRGNNSKGTQQVILLVHVQEIMQTTQDLRIQQLEIKYFEKMRTTTRYVRKKFLEEYRNFQTNTQDNDDRQEKFFPSS